MLPGKTQFCLHAAAVTSLRGSAVVYLQTEGSFPLARLQQIVRARYYLLQPDIGVHSILLY